MRLLPAVLLAATLAGCASPLPAAPPPAFAAGPPGEVRWAGTMRETIRGGRTAARVRPDSLAADPYLVAVGPVDGLRGEVTATGRGMLRAFVRDGAPVLEDGPGADGAPFLVWASVPMWMSAPLPAAVDSLAALERAVRAAADAAGSAAPFAFRVTGVAHALDLHVLHHPAGVPFRADDHDAAKVRFARAGVPVEVVGFYSEAHRTVWTHHDSFVHAHAVVEAGGPRVAGHVDALALRAGATLWLPAR